MFIVKNIVESHGGTISIESMVNRGTKTKIDRPKAVPQTKSGTAYQKVDLRSAFKLGKRV